MTERPPNAPTDPDESPAFGADESTGRREGLLSRRPVTLGVVIKILALGAINALAIWSLAPIIEQRWWPGLAMVVISTVLIDIAYLTKRAIPLKYLVPGTIFALAFQVVPVVYSGYIAFTNFSTANRLTQEQAIDQITARISNVPGSQRFQLTILGADDGEGEIAFLLVDEAGGSFLGTSEGLESIGVDRIVSNDAGKVQSVDGFAALNIRQIADRQEDILDEFEVPAETGIVKAATVNSAAVYERQYLYDEDSEILTDTETGVTYEPVDGRFVAADGATLEPGWQVFIGFDNFTRLFQSEAIRGPFLRVFVWNYVFAVVSVAISFAAGLALAIALNHPMLRGKKIYRSLLLLPYALPSFMTALIWRGMLNTEFGVINSILGSEIPWLRDPTLAKVSIILVNLWLSFPYWFLVATGALQAIPDELKEAAYVDGATSRQAFQRVIFPLLLVSLAPLTIASFGFTFNNFNIIYLLNRGGPPIVGAQTPAGHTDILISYTYRLSFESGRGAEWGFASAIAIIIFVMVATISAISFRRTRALEEVGR